MINEINKDFMKHLRVTPSNMLAVAQLVATKAHEGVLDKAGNPYIHHPIAVSMKVEGEIRKAAALLHDVVEDSNITMDDLREVGFPDEVLSIVFAVTRQIRDGQKEKYFDFVRRTKAAGEDAIAVKLADLEHNSSEERLAQLPPEERDIKKRYEKAKKIITGEIQ